MSPKPTRQPALGEAALLARLAERHPRPEWAFFPQVRDAAGFSAQRTIDALAMNTWPSRGLELHGFECKSDRRDWLREKNDPEKAERVARFCDRWWLVVGEESIVQPGELPPTWGLLVPRGERLVAVVEAPKLEPQPLGRSQVAVLLRRITEAGAPLPAEVEAQLKAAEERGRKAGSEDAKWQAIRAKQELDTLRQALADFEVVSGVKIANWNGARIGDAVKFVLEHGVLEHERRLKHLLEAARAAADYLDKALSGTREDAA